MKVRVQHEDGAVDMIEFAPGDWRLVDLGDVNYFVGAGVTHVFTSDGHYDSSRPVSSAPGTAPDEDAGALAVSRAVDVNRLGGR